MLQLSWKQCAPVNLTPFNCTERYCSRFFSGTNRDLKTLIESHWSGICCSVSTRLEMSQPSQMTHYGFTDSRQIQKIYLMPHWGQDCSIFARGSQCFIAKNLLREGVRQEQNLNAVWGGLEALLLRLSSPLIVFTFLLKRSLKEKLTNHREKVACLLTFPSFI